MRRDPTTPRRADASPWVAATLFVLTVALSGCTAVIATVQVINADRAVQEARLAGADALAPYEYTLAVRYQQEAAIQAAQSQNKRAATLAKTARAHAMVAKSKAAGGKRGMRSLDEAPATEPAKPDPGVPAPAPPPEPPTAPDADPARSNPADDVIPQAPPADAPSDDDEDFITPDDLWEAP